MKPISLYFNLVVALWVLAFMIPRLSLAASVTTPDLLDGSTSSSSVNNSDGKKGKDQTHKALRKRTQKATPFGQIQEVTAADPPAEDEGIDRTLHYLFLSSSYEYFSYSYVYYYPVGKGKGGKSYKSKGKGGKSYKSSKSKGKGGKSYKSSKGGYVYIAEDDDHYHHAVSGLSPPYHSKVGVVVDDDHYIAYSPGKGKGGKSHKSSKSKGKGGKSSKSSKGGYVYVAADDDDHYHHAVSGLSPPGVITDDDHYHHAVSGLSPPYHSKVGVVVEDHYIAYSPGKGKGGKSYKSSKSKGKGGKSSKSSKGGYVYVADDDDHYHHAVSGLSPPGVVTDDDQYHDTISPPYHSKVGVVVEDHYIAYSPGKGKGGKSSKSSKGKGNGGKSSKSSKGGYVYVADDDDHYHHPVSGLSPQYHTDDDDQYHHAISGLSPPGIVVEDHYIKNYNTGKRKPEKKNKGKGGKSSKSSKSKGKGSRSRRGGYVYVADDDYHYPYHSGYSRKN